MRLVAGPPPPLGTAAASLTTRLSARFQQLLRGCWRLGHLAQVVLRPPADGPHRRPRLRSGPRRRPACRDNNTVTWKSHDGQRQPRRSLSPFPFLGEHILHAVHRAGLGGQAAAALLCRVVSQSIPSHETQGGGATPPPPPPCSVSRTLCSSSRASSWPPHLQLPVRLLIRTEPSAGATAPTECVAGWCCRPGVGGRLGSERRAMSMS